jgi:hypothetical protein
MIFLFSPPTYFFLAFFPPKLESTTLILPKGSYFRHSLNGKGEFEIRGIHTNKKLGARFCIMACLALKMWETSTLNCAFRWAQQIDGLYPL